MELHLSHQGTYENVNNKTPGVTQSSAESKYQDLHRQNQQHTAVYQELVKDPVTSAEMASTNPATVYKNTPITSQDTNNYQNSEEIKANSGIQQN